METGKLGIGEKVKCIVWIHSGIWVEIFVSVTGCPSNPSGTVREWKCCEGVLSIWAIERSTIAVGIELAIDIGFD